MTQTHSVGIKLSLDATSVTSQLPRAEQAFKGLGTSVQAGAAQATQALARVQMSVADLAKGALGLGALSAALQGVGAALSAIPSNAFNYAKNLETTQLGMSGILASMTAMDGKQLSLNQALALSGQYMRQLNDDALRTAASSQELTAVFQALLAPGLSAKMSLDEIRQLTVVGTNAVKSMGLDAAQVVQELRDLVAGGINRASSTLATALGLEDADIAAAKASSEGLFQFLMARLRGFEASGTAFGDTLKGRLDSLQEGLTRVAAAGFEPLIAAASQAAGEVSAAFTTIDKASGTVAINDNLVRQLRSASEAAVSVGQVLKSAAGTAYEWRDAIMAVGTAWAAIKIGTMAASLAQVTQLKIEGVQASRLAAAQSAAEAASNTQVVQTSRAKLAAYMAELQAQVQLRQAELLRAQGFGSTTAAANNLAQAQQRLDAAQQAASWSARGFGAVVGALGGPIGIAITALTLLAGAFVSARREAQQAALADLSAKRVASGQGKEEDVSRLRGQLSDLKRRRDELLVEGETGFLANLPLLGKDRQTGIHTELKQTEAAIASVEKSLQAGEAAAAAASQATVGKLTLTAAGASQAWEQSISGIQTASSAQADYTQKLQASRDAMQSLVAAGVGGAELEKAQARQAEFEAGLKAEHAKKLKALAGSSAKGAAAAARQQHEEQKQLDRAAIEDANARNTAVLASYQQGAALVQALRSADLIDERTAHESKLAFVQLELEAKQRALADENALLAAQKLSGKDAIARQREIAKNTAQSVALAEAATAQTQALTIAEQARLAAGAKAASEQIKDLKDEAQVRELMAGKTLTQAQAVERVRIARLKEKLVAAQAANDPAVTAALEAEIAKREELLALMDSDAARAANAQAAADAAKDWEQTAQTIQSTLSEYIMNGGKDAAQYLKRLFSTLVLQPVVKAGVSDLLALLGLGGGGGGAGVAAAAGAMGKGGASSWLSLGSNLKSAYDLYSGGGMAGLLLGNAAAYGMAVPGLTVGGTQAAMLAAQTGAFGGAGLSATASAGATASGAGAAAGGLSATGIGAIVAAAVVAAGNLYKAGYTEDALTGVGKPGKLAYLLPDYGLAEHTNSVLKKLGVSEQWANMLSGTTAMAALFGRKLKDSGIEGSFGGEAGFTGQRFEYYKGGLLRSNKTVRSELDADTQAMLAGAFKSVHAGVKDMAQQLGLGGEALNGFSHQVKFSLKGLTQEESAALLQEELDKLGGAMAALLPGVDQYTQGNEGALQTITRLSGALQSANQAFDTLGYSLYDASLAGADMAQKLADAFGGLEQMGRQVGSFMQNFYSEAEQRQAVQRQLQKALDGLDLTLPDINAADARQQYRRLAESLDLTTEAGRAAWVQVLQLSDAFAGVTEPLHSANTALQAASNAAEEAARAAEEARRAWQQITDNLLGQRFAADMALLRAQGKQEQALQEERANAIAGMDAYQVGLYDGTQAILAQVQALKDQAAAAEAARQAAAQLSATLAAELPAVLDKYRSPTQRLEAGYAGIAADLAAAGVTVSASALMAASKDDIARVAMEVYNLGSTSDAARLALLRAAGGLADLKDEAQALREQASADAQSATDAAFAALEREAQTRRQLLQETIDDARAVFDAVGDAARSLYGEVASSRALLAEQGRAFIDNALANARASGYLPDAGELKQALEASTAGLAQQVYASQFEADRDRLLLAGKLRELKGISGEQLSEAQRQLKTLDDTLANARAQLDALRGIDASVQGVQARLEQLAAAMAAEQQAKNAAGGGGGGGGNNNRPGGQQLPGWAHWGNAGDWVANSSGSVVADAKTGMVYAQDGSTSSRGALVQAATDMLNAGQDRALYDAIAAGGFTLGQANQVLGLPAGSAEDWARGLGLPVYHQGTPLVPATGLALLQQGEAVIPRALNPFAAGAATGGGDAALVAELRAVRAELTALRATAERTATATARQAGQFDRVSAGGDALAVLLVNHTLRAEVAP